MNKISSAADEFSPEAYVRGRVDFKIESYRKKGIKASHSNLIIDKLKGEEMKSKWIFSIALLLTIVFVPQIQAVPSSGTATHIYNMSAPLIDGTLESIWNNAGQLSFSISTAQSFTINSQHYSTTDPSTYTVYFMHDDINLYVAVQSNDKQIEKSDYDQNADGLTGLCIQKKNSTEKAMFRLMLHQENQDYQGNSILVGPPIDRDRMVYDATWRSQIYGTWNDNGDQDSGYILEFSIPLSKIGDYMAGDAILANMVFADHDSNPDGRYDADATNFAKLWWGKDTAEDLSSPCYIVLSSSAPIGTSGTQNNIMAKRINSGAAPVIDGDPSDTIWNEAATENTLVFPNSVGQSWGPGTQAVYNSFDPGTYALKFLHDDDYLYVAFIANDKYVETADYNEASDGLISLVFDTGSADRRYSYIWSELDLWEQLNDVKKDCNDAELTNPYIHYQEGPPQYPYETQKITWAPSIQGNYNDTTSLDSSYKAEFRIPLSARNGASAGSRIPANIVIVDHDKNPGGSYNASSTRFRKYWWGTDHNEFYDPGTKIRYDITRDKERYITLGTNSPVGAVPSLTAAQKALNYIAGQQVKYTGLLRSYPHEQTAHTYDNAVALIALIDGGKNTEAQALATALMRLLQTDPAHSDAAFFYDAYGVIDNKVAQGTASGTGPNAWASYALARYGAVFNDQKAIDSADKVGRWIKYRLYDPADGGIWGGICHPFEERTSDNHAEDIVYNYKSTEQVIDTWHLFKELHYPEKANVESWLFTKEKGWVAADPLGGQCCRQDNRFSTGTNTEGFDRRLYLDTQAWGSIIASMVGKSSEASSAITASENWMKETQLVNGQTITGYNDACLPDDDAIWYGGTAHMIAAYVYKNDLISAQSLLYEMAKAQNADGSWSHSSKDSDMKYSGQCGAYSSYHNANSHVGETAWNYFAFRDVNDGKMLPYSIAAHPIPNIKANESDGPVNITKNENLLIQVELNPGGYLNENADWWVVADTPFGLYHFDVIGGSWSWLPDLSVSYKGPLFNLTPFEVLNATLPLGTYIFYFGVDINMNRSLDIHQLFYDGVTVNIIQ